MGTVLEMMRTGMGLAAAALLALTGCGAGGNGSGEARAVSIINQARGVFAGVGTDQTVDGPRGVPGGFSAEAIAADPGAFRVVQINALGLQEPGRIIQQNGDEITLALQSGPTAAFDGGVLVSTRGFGDDLFTVESRGVLEALRAGGGTVTRRMERLTSLDQVVADTFTCTIAPAGTETVNLGLREASLRRYNESCRSTSVIFDNIYWLNDGGEIVASRQYVSPTVAYLRSNRL